MNALFPSHLLGPNDLLRVVGYINGTQEHFLFDSGSSHNFLNDHFVQQMELHINASDHIYQGSHGKWKRSIHQWHCLLTANSNRYLFGEA